MSIPGPMWAPSDEKELERAASGGLLTEGHYLDIKRGLGELPSDRKEAAKDIASFAIDGGVLIYGVDEQKNAPPVLTPQPVHDLSERIEGIARTRVSEPISVRTTQISAAAGGGLGYLVVRVPASPRAPHMVDGRYYGRDERTKRILTDDEVRRLHQLARVTEADVTRIAQEELHRAHARGERDVQPMLVVVAEPLGAPDELLVPLTDAGEGAIQVMHTLSNKAAVPAHQDANATSLAEATGYRRVARGVALTRGLTPQGTFRGYSGEIVFYENGRLVLVADGPVSVRQFPNVVPTVASTLVIVEPVVAGHVDHLVRLCATVAENFKFAGSWTIAVAIGDNLAGAQSDLRTSARYGGEGGPYTDDTYWQATTASLEELNDAPHRVVNRLIAPLLRSLDSRRGIPWLSPDETD